MVKNKGNNLAILGPFRELTLETPDSIFCDLLNELFRMNKKIFWKKNQILKSYFEVPIFFCYFFLEQRFTIF